jgi:hypothetical protein
MGESYQPAGCARAHVAASDADPARIALDDLLRALQAVRDGDFSARLPAHWTGVAGKASEAGRDSA